MSCALQKICDPSSDGRQLTCGSKQAVSLITIITAQETTLTTIEGAKIEMKLKTFVIRIEKQTALK